jgi:bis(5'-nucleosyl)-tetraphosphatase (symmetrical)
MKLLNNNCVKKRIWRMATYAIGDIQGCIVELIELLDKIQFDSKKDTLWFTGDLVNRGPQSLEVLRFIKSLGPKHHVVLGNHDMHLLALAYGTRKCNSSDTLDNILQAHDKIELIEWLRYRPLLHFESTKRYALVHAGLACSWDINQALSLSREVETVLQSDHPEFLFKNMYGIEHNNWSDNLTGIERLCCITNYLTRMRYCYLDGRLNLTLKGKIEFPQDGLLPWFLLPNRVNANIKIFFGHWSALNGVTNTPNVYALDTGCGEGKGNTLTAMRLEDKKRFATI